MQARTRGSSSRGAMVVAGALAFLAAAAVTFWFLNPRRNESAPSTPGAPTPAGMDRPVPGATSASPASAAASTTAPANGTSPTAPGAPAESPGGGLPAAVPYFDGERWVEAYPADDEVHVILENGAVAGFGVVGAVSTERTGDGVYVRVQPMGSEELRRWAQELATRPSVREVRPIYYATLQALAERSAGQRMSLTRQIAVEIPAGLDPEEAIRSHGARLVEELSYRPGTYLIEVSSPFETLALAARLMEEGWPAAMPQFARQHYPRRGGGDRWTPPNDTLFAQQWHLQNSGLQPGWTAGEDIDVVNVWGSGTRGEGIVVCVIDDGVQGNHPDLLDNYSATHSIDINGGDAVPSPEGGGDNHGTQVAGSVAARGNNAIGVSGSAPRATLAAIRLTAAATTAAEDAQAMNHLNASIHVKNNSWGPADLTGLLAGQPTLVRDAIRDGVTTGRNGLGVLYLWAAGNGGVNGPDDVNYDGYANNRNVIAVGATTPSGVAASFSEQGAAMLVTAPGTQIRTTDRTAPDGDDAGSDYVVMQGTSFSTPITAGAVALLLQAYPNLTYRDVMWILVNTAETNDSGDPGWATNNSGRTVNHKYGHGRINVQAALTAAASWTSVGGAAQEAVQTGNFSPNQVIVDNDPTGIPSTITIADAITVEHVEVDVNITHTFRGDLDIRLTSPGGTVSRLARQRTEDNLDNYDNWTFLTTHCWAESGQGNWTLTVADVSVNDTGTFNSWTIRVYGTTGAPPPGGPAIGLNPTSLSFSGTAGGANPDAQTFALSNTGGGTLSATITVDQTWLRASPTPANVASGQSTTITVSVDLTGLAAGTHTATITITDTGATNSPRTVSVSLTLAEPASDDGDGGGGGCHARDGAGSLLLVAGLVAGLLAAARIRPTAA